jgi:hypothetical protein
MEQVTKQRIEDFYARCGHAIHPFCGLLRRARMIMQEPYYPDIAMGPSSYIENLLKIQR